MIIIAKSNVNVSMSIQVSISSKLGRSSNSARIEMAAVAISMEITWSFQVLKINSKDMSDSINTMDNYRSVCNFKDDKNVQDNQN